MIYQMTFAPTAVQNGHWILAKDGDPRLLALYENHYSAYRYGDGRKRKLCVGPGQRLIMVTREADAAFIWKVWQNPDGNEGIYCSFFRNEGATLSSQLITEAMQLAWQKWPNERRMYTYVDAAKIISRNPGYCFKMAGWRQCGITKVNKLLIFEYIR